MASSVPVAENEEVKRAPVQVPVTGAEGIVLPGAAPVSAPLVGAPAELGVDADKNEALEGQKAADEVFRNIFGDDSEDED